MSQRGILADEECAEVKKGLEEDGKQSDHSVESNRMV
jgi:hypothetical protein